MIETSEGLKFVPGEVVETQNGSKFIPGQTINTPDGPRFIPGTELRDSVPIRNVASEVSSFIFLIGANGHRVKCELRSTD